MNYKPVNDYVLIKRTLKAEKTESGLFIPEVARGRTNEGEVLALGPNCSDCCKIGDTVVFSINSEFTIKDDDDKDTNYVVVGEANIILHQSKKIEKEESTIPLLPLSLLKNKSSEPGPLPLNREVLNKL